MQVNELVGQIKQGTRLPDIDRAFNDTRRTGAKLSKGIGQNPDGREAIAGTTRVPRRYGAGF